MNLVGLQLQEAGLAFLSVRATHHVGGIRLDEVVCRTADDAARVDAWALKNGYGVLARVATSAELAEHEALPA